MTQFFFAIGYLAFLIVACLVVWVFLEVCKEFAPALVLFLPCYFILPFLAGDEINHLAEYFAVKSSHDLGVVGAVVIWVSLVPAMCFAFRQSEW